MATAGRYLGSAVLLFALGLSPALGYATTFVLLGLGVVAAGLFFTERSERAAHPSPTLPVKGRVSAGAEGTTQPQARDGTSPLSPAVLFLLAWVLLALSALATVRTPADLLPLLGLAAPLFYAPLVRVAGGLDLVRYALPGAFAGLAVAMLYRYGFGMARAAEGFWLTDPYRLAVTTLLAAVLGLGAWLIPGERRRLLSLFALAAALAVIVLTGSRTALLALPVLLLVTGLCIARRTLTQVSAVVIAMAVVAAALFVELPGTARLRLWDVLAGVVSGEAVTDPAIGIRLGLAQAATQMFGASPLLGHGWGEGAMDAVRALLAPEQLAWGAIPHLHSDIGQFAVSGGLAGLAAWLLLLAAPICGYLQLPRKARTPARFHALAVLVTGAVVLGLPDTFLAAPMTLAIYVVLAAAIAGSRE